LSDPTQPGASNRGVQNLGAGTINISESAIGDQPSVLVRPDPGPGPKSCAATEKSPWDVGVVTVLSEETSAVTDVLAASGKCRKNKDPAGPRFCEAEVDTSAGLIRVVATQTVNRGQRSAALAFEQLRTRYSPAIVALVGIAGGINPAVSLGDVVVAQEVIYYDIRKETDGGIVHRGQAQPVPATVRHAMNDFFSSHGEPYRASIQDQAGVSRTIKVLPGPIGSGEAVVANKDSEIRTFLTRFNDKTLALETEAGGLAEAFYEMAAALPAGSGWLSIRGISDHADAGKDDAYHEIASWHAATIFLEMLPYLKPQEG
jgi:adenosylhomocysteine nucleosidase